MDKIAYTLKKENTENKRILKEQVKVFEEEIRSNMYKNILVGYHHFPEPPDLFISLGKRLGVSTLLARHFFEQFRQNCYCGTLRVPPSHFNLFFKIREAGRVRVTFQGKARRKAKCPKTQKWKRQVKKRKFSICRVPCCWIRKTTTRRDFKSLNFFFQRKLKFDLKIKVLLFQSFKFNYEKTEH